MSFLKELFYSFARTLGRILVYLLLGFIIFYITNDIVNAKVEITFKDSERMRNGTGTSAINYGTLLNECLDTTYCTIPSSNIFNQRIMVANYTRIDSSVANENYLYLNGNNYTINYNVRLYRTNGDMADLKPTMGVMDANLKWILATCDSGQSYSSTIRGEPGTNYSYVQTFTYKCNSLKSTLNVNSVRFGAYSDTVNGALSGSVGWQIETKITDNSRVGTDTDKIINNQNQNQQQTNQGLQDIEDAILDTSQPNLDNFNYTDTTGGLISTFLTMPITLLRVMNNVDTCRSITLGELFGTPLRLDCINPGVFLGDTLWNIIDYFIVFTMIISISQLFIYVYEKFKNLEDFFNEFYTPQHMAPDSYVPRHGGGN